MADKGVFIIDRVVQEQIKGGVDLEKNMWYIPIPKNDPIIKSISKKE